MEGVTPFVIECRKCGRHAFSSTYRINTQEFVKSGIPIAYEWVAKTPDELMVASDTDRDHAAGGGLFLRELDTPVVVYPQMLSSDQIAVTNAAMALFVTPPTEVAQACHVDPDIAETLMMYLRNTLGVYLFQNMSNPDPTVRQQVQPSGAPTRVTA